MTMASRNSTSELVAIYRLEFYKKQKNWKLSASARKEKERKKQSTSHKSKLNKTYNVESQVEDDKTELNPLNVAFCEPEIESVTAKTLRASSTKPCLSQQWLEPVDIRPKNIKTSEPSVPVYIANKSEETPTIQSKKEVGSENFEPKKAWIKKRLEVLLKAAEARDCDAQSESGLEKLAKRNGGESFETNQEQDVSNNDIEENWVPEGIQRAIWSEPWINSAELAQDVWLDRDVVDGLNFKSRPVDAVLSKIPWLTESLEGEKTVDSASEFIRGAHVAPHSSELDLALPSGLRIGEVTSEMLCHLSSRQLKQVMSEHWRLLTRLLREQQTRQNLRSSISLYTDISSFDEYPTRDVGPSAPSPTYRDDFVAGSHRIFHSVELGRGRGRSLQNRSGFSFGGTM